MLIVNTTYNVSENCRKDWLIWIHSDYIPEVIRTGFLVNPRFYRLLIENEPGTESYALQFEVKNQETLDGWFQKYGMNIQETMSHRFHENVLGFTTLMEAVE
jgi:hypothetical protein